MFAATHPDRVTALVLVGVSPSVGSFLTEDRLELLLDVVENGWGEGRLLPIFAPSKVGDRQFEDWWIR